jgi:2-oxoglutarate dehydrogenase E2 component (dihydrolipoamide succinyltransferase)
MSLEVKIPSVGESITSGVISAWHKADGEAVTKGDTLLTLDTDKVSTDLTAEESGVIRIHAQAGDEVNIGQVVAVIEVATAAAPAVAAPATAKVAAELAPAPAPVVAAATPVSGAVLKPAALPSSGAGLLAAVEAANHSLGALQGTGEPSKLLAEGRTSRKRMTPLRRKIAAQLVSAQHQAHEFFH